MAATSRSARAINEVVATTFRSEAVMHPGIGVAAVIATAVAVAPTGVASAQPIAPGGAYEVINDLENDGYDVTIDRVGNAPINQCLVTSVRNPHDVTKTYWVGDKEDHDRRLITVVVRRYITVSLNCDV
jgi:hypothetical protein